LGPHIPTYSPYEGCLGFNGGSLSPALNDALQFAD